MPTPVHYKTTDGNCHVSYPLGYNTSYKGIKKNDLEKMSNVLDYFPVFGAISGIDRLKESHSILKSKKIVNLRVDQKNKTIKNRVRGHKARAIISICGLGFIFLIPDIIVSIKNSRKKRLLKTEKKSKKKLHYKNLENGKTKKPKPHKVHKNRTKKR